MMPAECSLSFQNIRQSFQNSPGVGEQETVIGLSRLTVHLSLDIVFIMNIVCSTV